jgi:imidazolonepropionase-like amidohydrolase
MTGGHYIGRVVDGPGEVRKAAREMIHKGADFIKVIATGGVGKPGEQFGAQEFFYDELSEAFGVARMANKPSAAHVHGLEAIRDCIRAGVTSVEHGTFIDAETAEMMAEKDVFLVPTFAVYACMAKKGQFGGVASHMMDSSKTILEAKVSRFRYALNAGVKIAFGTDAGTPLNTHEDIVTEAQEMVEAGASNMTVIKSLTDWAAKLVKLDMVIGSISQGKVAELILLDGNPLEDIAALGKVVMVVKEGCIVRG